MKKFFSLAIGLLSSLPLLASINTMNYQAVINQPDGTPAADKEIGMKFAIVSGDQTLLTEETVVKSSSEGLVEWQIGSTTESGIAEIDWSAEGIMLQVGIDLYGGTNYTSVYSSTIQSVPTSVYSIHSGDTDMLLDNIYKVYEEINVRNDESLMYINDLQKALEENRMYTDENMAMIKDTIAMLDETRAKLETEVAYSRTMIDDLRHQVDELTARNYDQEDAINHLMQMVVDLQAQIEELRK